MPPYAAKRMSPLDNALFHEWKEKIRRRTLLTKENIEGIMADEWNKLNTKHLMAYYQFCGLTVTGGTVQGKRLVYYACAHYMYYYDCLRPSR